MEFKGTKGKLRQSKNYFTDTKGNNAKWICIKDEQDRTIAEVKGRHHGIEDKECKANALLISKAPEMLEMLKRLTKLISDIDGTLFHHNHSVNGWHLNGDFEPIMNFVSEMDMEALSDAEILIKEATEL